MNPIFSTRFNMDKNLPFDKIVPPNLLRNITVSSIILLSSIKNKLLEQRYVVRAGRRLDTRNNIPAIKFQVVDPNKF